ncbi:MAG: hypothetical protein ABJQ90_00010 [Parasphingorhabdus sp.]
MNDKTNHDLPRLRFATPLASTHAAVVIEIRENAAEGRGLLQRGDGKSMGVGSGGSELKVGQCFLARYSEKRDRRDTSDVGAD